MRDQPSELRTARLTLRPMRVADAAALFQLQNDWDVVRMLANPPWPLALEDVAAHAALQEAGTSDSDDFTIRAGETIVGVAGVKRPGTGDPPRTMPRLGYWIGRAHWNTGYAGEALRALVAYPFARFPGERIGAGVFEDNPASRRVLEKLGFEQRGGYETFSRARGAAVPTIEMQLTRQKFESLRP